MSEIKQSAQPRSRLPRRDRLLELFALLRDRPGSHDPKAIATTLDMSLATVYRHLKALVQTGTAQVAEQTADGGSVGYCAIPNGPAPEPLPGVKWTPEFNEEDYRSGGYSNATVGGYSLAWTPQEDDLIMRPGTLTDKKLEAFLHRSRKAIQIRRSRIRARHPSKDRARPTRKFNGDRHGEMAGGGV